MIELRLHPPFTVADLVGFTRLARPLDPDAEVDVGEGYLSITASAPDEWPRPDPRALRTAPEPDTPAVDRIEAARAAVDRTTEDIAAVRAAKSHATRRAGEINTDAGTVAGQILRTVAAERGMWEDSLSELAREAWPSNPESAHPTARTMEKAGLIRCRREGRSVVAVELLAAGWDALGDDGQALSSRAPRGSTPAPVEDAPVVAPELGAFERRKFDPDAARSGAAGAL